MNDKFLPRLWIEDSDVVAGRPVVYCKEVSDPHELIGRRFRCNLPMLEFTIKAVSSRGATNLDAFVYCGDQVPAGQFLEFYEIC